jgi:hypothetical protein
MELLGFLLELIEATLGIGIDGILGVFTDVELDLELLRGTHDALLKTLETHDGVWGDDRSRKIGERREERKENAGGNAKGGGRRRSSSYEMGELLRPCRSQP